MKLSDLIARIGDENVQVQPLEGCLKNVHKRKDHAEITFTTDRKKGENLIDSIFRGHEPDHVCLVLWLPRKLVPYKLFAGEEPLEKGTRPT